MKIFNEITSYIYETALHIAVEKENIEIIKLLLSKENIDINLIKISNIIIQYNFKNKHFNTILKINL